MPKNAFFTTDKTDNIWRLRHAGRSENIKWGRSDLKPGKFKFSDFLDISNTTDLQFRLSERIFVYDTLGLGIGYTPHQVLAQGYQVYTKCRIVKAQSLLEA